MIGDFNAALNDEDISDDPLFYINQGKIEVDDIGDKGFGGTTANERLRMSDLLEEGGLVDTFRSRPGHLKKPQFTWKRKRKFKNKGMKLDFNLVDKSIADSGGVEADLIMNGDRGPKDIVLWTKIICRHGFASSLTAKTN
jgi:exonuclease III